MARSFFLPPLLPSFFFFVSPHTFILRLFCKRDEKHISLFCSLPECEKLAIKCSMCVYYLYDGEMMNLLDIPASTEDLNVLYHSILLYVCVCLDVVKVERHGG